jgi:hypothetical protein
MRSDLFSALLLSAVLAGCGYPPTAGYVTESPPPASDAELDYAGAYDLVVTENAATGIVFLVYAPETFSGTRAATAARSLDDSIVRVVPATSEGNVQYGSPDYTGQVFVLVGVAPGTTEIEVSRNGGDTGSLGVRVVAQTD